MMLKALQDRGVGVCLCDIGANKLALSTLKSAFVFLTLGGALAMSTAQGHKHRSLSLARRAEIFRNRMPQHHSPNPIPPH